MDINYNRALKNAFLVSMIGIGFPIMLFVIWALVMWEIPIFNELGQSMVFPWIRAWILLGLIVGFGQEMTNS